MVLLVAFTTQYNSNDDTVLDEKWRNLFDEVYLFGQSIYKTFLKWLNKVFFTYGG